MVFGAPLDALAVAGLLVLGLAVLLLAIAARLRGGLPAGRVLHADTGARRQGRRLYSARYGLVGTPDYILDTPQGLVPVELKPGRTDSEPHESHLLQVLAYCLLMEDAEGSPPPHGLLRYKHDTFKVDYNKATRAYLLSVIEAMREAMDGGPAARSHQVPGRCRACAYRAGCDESLWADR